MKKYVLISLLTFVATLSYPQKYVGPNYIYGTVMVKQLQDKDVLIGAHIVIKQYHIVALTDIDGLYKMYIPDSLLGKRVEIEYLYVGYKSFKKKIRLKNFPRRLNIIIHDARKVDDIA